MKITWDSEATAVFIYIKENEKPENSIEIGSKVIIELGKNAEVISIEVLGVDRPEIVEIGKNAGTESGHIVD